MRHVHDVDVDDEVNLVQIDQDQVRSDVLLSGHDWDQAEQNASPEEQGMVVSGRVGALDVELVEQLAESLLDPSGLELLAVLSSGKDKH